MATFLELAQKLARESGTVSGNLPSSVVNQTGRLAKIVHWTADAWQVIQNRRNAWLWMRGEFEGTSTAGAGRYTAASFGIERWAEWIIEPDTVTLYKQSAGIADEGPILYLPWHLYRRLYERGVQNENRPIHFSVSPAGEFCLGPKPDGAYVIRGEYRKTPQRLVANEDVPEMPARFHDAIVFQALLLMAEHDEGGIHMATAMRRYREIMGDLERDQLPRIEIGAGALA